MTLISTACSWVNMFGGHKAAIFTQVGQFYFGTLGQFSIGVDRGLSEAQGHCQFPAPATRKRPIAPTLIREDPSRNSGFLLRDELQGL